MNLGIVGTGTIVEEVLPVLYEKPQITLTAICSTKRSETKRYELQKQYEIPQGYTDFSQLLADPACNTVYIALPNHLHYSYARQALEAGKHVIVEKPITSHTGEANDLAGLAKAKQLFLFEAITTMYSAHYQKVKELLPRIGKIKLISCNFSQYSRRYDAFLAGDIQPVFDPAKSGGVLMDLNSYNIQYVAGILGVPQGVFYHTTMEQGIDTGGILVLDYPDCHAVCIASKSCTAPCHCQIQGPEGYILQTSPANVCGPVELHLNNGTVEHYDLTPPATKAAPNHSHRMSEEFDAFATAIDSGNYAICEAMLNHSLVVSDILTRARQSAGIVFPADSAF